MYKVSRQTKKEGNGVAHNAPQSPRYLWSLLHNYCKEYLPFEEPLHYDRVVKNLKKLTIIKGFNIKYQEEFKVCSSLHPFDVSRINTNHWFFLCPDVSLGVEPESGVKLVSEVAVCSRPQRSHLAIIRAERERERTNERPGTIHADQSQARGHRWLLLILKS